ncbi:MAG: alpha/beta hydrolase [Deltaproteobacteria bacterium]|nr:alpha/beta hydrolase [Deltaproteobacteria bacterium]
MSWLTKGFYFGKKGMEVRRLSFKKILTRTLVAVAVTFALLLGAVFLFKNKIIFFPSKEFSNHISKTSWPFEDVWLTGTNGRKFNSWYLPADADAPVVLLFHGNAGNLELMIGRIMLYHQLGYGVMAVDYEGFGLSEGSPSEEAAYADAEAAWNFLLEKNIAPEKILIHGFSLGGGVAAYLAESKKESRNPLILDSTFTTLQDAAVFHAPYLKPLLPYIIGDSFNTLERLANVSPSFLLVLHSPDDEIVPFELGLRNYDSYAGGPKSMTVLRGEHMDYLLNVNSYQAAIAEVFGYKGKWNNFPVASSADCCAVESPDEDQTAPSLVEESD